jgi:ribosomal protein L37E
MEQIGVVGRFVGRREYYLLRVEFRKRVGYVSFNWLDVVCGDCGFGVRGY